MEKQYCFDISFPNVDFEKFETKSEKCPKIFHAHLIVRENEIEIRLFYKSETRFEWKLNEWLNKINWNQFGTHISTSNFSSNERITAISFTEAILLKVKSGSHQIEGELEYVSIFVDWVRTDWKLNEEQINTAEFYLNEAGFNMVNQFYSPMTMFGLEGEFKIHRMRGQDVFYPIDKAEFRPEFNFCSSDKKDEKEAKVIKEPKFQFRYEKNTSIEDALKYAEIVCLLSSFFYSSKIEYSFAKAHLSDKTITIKKIIEPQIKKTNPITLWAVKYHKDFDSFLNSNWQDAALKNYKKLQKIIPKFIQSIIIDGSSTFLLRYNIIEVCKGGKKNDNEKFNRILKENEHNEKYDEALKLLLETVDEKDCEDFKNKWKNVKDKLEYRPMKSDIEEFLKSQCLCITDFPIKVDKLVQMRSSLTHGSVNRVKKNQLDIANALLYRINIILILNLLGLNDIWKFDKEIKERN